MCGIFGFVTRSQRSATTVLSGLQYLEYRGYDSWGIAVGLGGEVVAQKEVGQIAGARTSLPDAPVALGHTRWPTHGGVTQANAHPHLDCAGRFALIHNGIVENYRELGARLRPGHTFRSQTDSEVLAHMLEESLEAGSDLISGLISVFRQVEGLSAVAVLDAATGRLAVAKNGSPLVIGRSEDGSYLASDPIAVLDHTRDVTFLEDGQAALLTADGIRVCDVASGATIEPDIVRLEWDTTRAGLDGYDHFMAKEMDEQPRVLRELAAGAGVAVAALADLVRRSSSVYLIGCGTAHNAAMSGRYMLGELAGIQSTAAVASEMSLIYPALGPGSLVIALSQSGETIDVLEAVKMARERGAAVAALVNAEGSALHRFADLSVVLRAGPERCVLATKSYTAKLAVLQMLARTLAGQADRGRQEVSEASYRLEELLDRERSRGAIAAAARAFGDHQHLFVLGRHRNYPLALEAALKIKEVSYLHAEGFAAGELKHGVIALVAPGTPCIVLAPDDCMRGEALSAAAQVRARGALTVGISPAEEEEFALTLPVSGTSAAPFEIAVICQMLAYNLALLRGCDPDKPRNLAKSVTVK